MSIQGFQCQSCRTFFEDWLPDDVGEVVEIKCPQCASTEVVRSDEASEFLELLQEMGRTGG